MDRRLGFNIRLSHTKDLEKLVLDTSLLSNQYYKVRIKGKAEQSMEGSNALPYASNVVSIEKGAFSRRQQLYFLYNHISLYIVTYHIMYYDIFYYILSHLILSYLILSYIIMLYHYISSYIIKHFHMLSYIILQHIIIYYYIFSYIIFSFIIVYNISYYYILSYIILSYIILSYIIIIVTLYSTLTSRYRHLGHFPQ